MTFLHARKQKALFRLFKKLPQKAALTLRNSFNNRIFDTGQPNGMSVFASLTKNLKPLIVNPKVNVTNSKRPRETFNTLDEELLSEI